MSKIIEAIPPSVSSDDVDIWFQDETRVGQQGSRTRIWAEKGTRPRVVKQQQFLSQYIFGAINPSNGLCSALILPFANTECLQLHLEEISNTVPSGRHAVLIMDCASWHKGTELKAPSNISILHLPPYSPELNPQEGIWQYLKDTFLSNRVFKDIDDITDACCHAWNALADCPELIKSIGYRSWAAVL